MIYKKIKTYLGLPYQITFDYGNMGIGDYEYWGARYCQIQMGCTVLDYVPVGHTTELSENEAIEATEYWETSETELFREKEENQQ